VLSPGRCLPGRAALALTALGLAITAPAVSASTLPAGSASQLISELRHTWQITKGRGVTVAVLSNGVDPHVTGLAGKVTAGPDYVRLRDPQGLDGTLIANGIAGDAPSAGNPLGTLGLAPAARIISVRVYPDTSEPGSQNFDNSVFSPDMLAEGIRYSVGHGAGVIYIDVPPSLIDSADLDSAVQYALAKGVLITTMAAADNGGPADVTYPGAIPGIITATMVALPSPLPPPGGANGSTETNDSVLVSVPDNTLNEIGPGNQPYTVWSFDASAAWLAGTAALIKSAYPRLPPGLAARAIALSARDHPAGGYDVMAGFGLIDPYGALTEAGKLARLSGTAASSGLSPAARFGRAPGVIYAVHRSAARIAAFAAVTVLGVILLAAALLLARRKPRAARVSRHAARRGRAPARLQELAQRQQVPHAGLDLDPPGQPHPGDVGRGGGQRDHVVAVPGQPDIGRRLIRRRLFHRLGAMLGDPGYERHAEIGDMAAE